MGEKYTFEDWKLGKIAQDYRKGEIYLNLIEGKRPILSCKPGKLPLSLYHHGLISEKAIRKSEMLKKRHFLLLLISLKELLRKNLRKSYQKLLTPKNYWSSKLKTWKN
jgi:hypothetical protein